MGSKATHNLRGGQLHPVKKPPIPDVAERRAIREQNRKAVDANAAIGINLDGSYEPAPNPYGGPAAGSKPKRK